MNTKLVSVLLVAGSFAAVLACTQQPSPAQNPVPPQTLEAPAPPPVSVNSAAACAAFEAKPGHPVWPEIPNAETQLALVESLESRLANAGAETPGILLELGRAKARFAPGRGTPQARHAEARSGEFSYNEIGGSWLYRGRDFNELIRRFPGHELVDDAAYELTLLPQWGECEGWIPCYVSRQWEPLATFFKAYPDSPLADAAVERTLAAFGFVETDKDLRVATDFSGPEEIRKLTASLETVGRMLPASRSGRLLLRAAELWEAFFDYNRAKDVYRAALQTSDSAVRGCASARIDGLPARWFTLEPARVIHPQRVELAWEALASLETGYAVYRSTAKSEPGNIVAQLPSGVRSWADTTTEPGRTYWYRVSAGARDGAAVSNAAAAETPALALASVLGIAVSSGDQRLHVFGYLSNGFPQVVHVASDGTSVERDNAEFIGLENGAVRPSFAPYVKDVWLVDGDGHRALRFQGEPGALPASLPDVVRQGRDLLRIYPFTHQNAGLSLIVSIDEKEKAAWITQGGGGGYAPIAMDCLATPSVCWLGGERDVRLQDQSGRGLTTVPLPQARGSLMWATKVFADPVDASVWVLRGQAGSLLHIGRDGTIRQDVTLTERTRAYSINLTADLARREIWFTRSGAGGRSELLQLDLNGPNGQAATPRIISDSMPAVSDLAPDFNGGLWLLYQQTVSRMAANGQIVFTIRLDAPPKR